MKISIEGSEANIKSLLKTNRLFLSKKGLKVEFDEPVEEEVKDSSFQDRIQKNIVKKFKGKRKK
jgi:hypothetical protein